MFSFVFFILITALFYFNPEAHKYYNNSFVEYNFNSVLSVIMIILFSIFFWITIIYPIFCVIQIGLTYYYKIFDTKKLVLIIVSIILYIISIGALFSIYSIEQHQSFVERAKNN